jgi:hypothetical protein
LQKKTDSLSKDLKKVMKEDALAISEFEKALIRKSEECNVYYYYNYYYCGCYLY